MEKILVAHYKNKLNTMCFNGGKLLIDSGKIVLKNFFVTVAIFDKDSLNIKILPNGIMGYKIVELSDADKSYELMLFEKDFKKLKMELID